MNEKKKHRSSLGNSRRPNTASCGYSNTLQKRADPEEKEWNSSLRIMKTSSFPQSKNDSFDQEDISAYDKNLKQLPNKKKKGANKSIYQADFVPTEEVMPVISMAAFAQDQVIQMLRTIREEFLKRILKERKSYIITNGANICQSTSPLSLVKGIIIKESRDSYSLTDYWSNNFDEILHVWIHLFYFIINIKMNLIKIKKATGEERIKPDAEAEMDILTQAIECVKFFSILKMKILAESMEEIRFSDDFKKGEKETKENEDCILSPFLLEMELLGKRVKEILSQINNPSETPIKSLS